MSVAASRRRAVLVLSELVTAPWSTRCRVHDRGVAPDDLLRLEVQDRSPRAPVMEAGRPVRCRGARAPRHRCRRRGLGLGAHGGRQTCLGDRSRRRPSSSTSTIALGRSRPEPDRPGGRQSGRVRRRVAPCGARGNGPGDGGWRRGSHRVDQPQVGHRPDEPLARVVVPPADPVAVVEREAVVEVVVALTERDECCEGAVRADDCWSKRLVPTRWASELMENVACSMMPARRNPATKRPPHGSPHVVATAIGAASPMVTATAG